jgi:hypothetical protein
VVPSRAEVLRAAFGTSPELLVTLTEPLPARGLLGIQRRVTGIALYLDEPDRPVAALDNDV